MPAVDPGSIVLAVAVAAVGYLVGGIPFGVVVSRIVAGRDPRSIGSGRTGGANVLRTVGPRWALVSGLLDAAKGSVCVLVPRLLGLGAGYEAIAALMAIVGHSRSPYIGFGGGRGVSVAWGTLLVIQPLVAVVIVPAFAAIILVTRISSLGSLAGSLLGGALTVWIVASQGLPAAYAAYAVGSVALIWLFHHDNIARLLRGTERRIDRRD